MSSYEVLLRADFSAAHQLRLDGGRLEPLHGHNWRVEVTLQGDKLDSMGVLVDFTIVMPHLREITDGLDNTFLNELSAFSSDNPSTELVAKYIHDQMAERIGNDIRIVKVRVWETGHCAAAYVPDARGHFV